MDDQRDRLGGRNGDIWRSYVAGRNQEWIAGRFGVSQQRVSQIVHEVRDALPPDAREDWRVSALETLGHLHAEMVEVVNRESPPAFDQSGTTILRDENGVVVRDVSSRLSAVDRVVRIQERAARLLGLDAPERVDATVHQVTPEDGALAELVREAQAAAAVAEAQLRGGV